MQHDVAQRFKTRNQGYQQYAVHHLKKLTLILQARLDKFPLFMKKKKKKKKMIIRKLSS